MYCSRYIYQDILFVKKLTTPQFLGGSEACEADEKAAGEKVKWIWIFFLIFWPRFYLIHRIYRCTDVTSD